VDTLRADRLGAYGWAPALTPRADALARAGVRFDEAITPMPRTTPALASLLTGLPPHRHGSREVGQPMGAAPTLPALLAGAGYAAVGVSATRVAGPKQGLDRGFDAFRVLHDRRASRVARRALSMAEEAAGWRRPLFLWVHFVDPHFPYHPPGAIPPENTCWPLVEAVEAGERDRVPLFIDAGGAASAALDDCGALYDGEVAAADEGLGVLLDGLRALGRPQPVVIFSADHGENLGEEGLYFEHGPSLHEASLRVPLIVAGPGLREGLVDAAVARLEDLAPTALALAGVPASSWPEMEGVDLGPRLRGEGGGEGGVATAEAGAALQVGLSAWPVSGRADKRWCVNGPRYSLCEEAGQLCVGDREAPGRPAARPPEAVADLVGARAAWPAEGARQRAARGARWKLVERPRLEGGYQRALYDLAADPAEARDLSLERDAPAALTAALEAFTAALPPRGAGRDEETVEALRALGYVE